MREQRSCKRMILKLGKTMVAVDRPEDAKREADQYEKYKDLKAELLETYRELRLVPTNEIWMRAERINKRESGVVMSWHRMESL